MELHKVNPNMTLAGGIFDHHSLISKVKSYDPGLNKKVLLSAFEFSKSRHQTQLRESGEPYFFHPLAVARILTEYKLDWMSIATALLHDTVEDEVATRAEIRKLFGAEIARLVDGVTKFSKIESTSLEISEAENFRKFILAISRDIRVLLVKLADRLHNMRTIEFISSEERRSRIAKETLDIYAPLAQRIGVQKIREELEDIAFSQLNPSVRSSLSKRIDFLRKEDGRLVKSIINDLNLKLKNDNNILDIQGREKTIYSIWKKMNKSSIPFEKISDIYAFRVICSDTDTCYNTLGSIHQIWPMIPGRFKDYISTPKSNGYSSLHTTVIGPVGRAIEVQIKTQEMHEIAEYGVAAHWDYKVQGSSPGKKDKSNLKWFKELNEILGNSAAPEDLLVNTKMEMYSDQVFCFTPKGDVISLPKGATPIDFAFAVHSKIGETCVGAKINGRSAPLQTLLSNGNQIEILRSNAQSPQSSWLNYVVTGKARSYINNYVRKNDREEFAKLGRSILENKFLSKNKKFYDKLLDPILKRLAYRSRRSLFVDIGQAKITSEEVIKYILPDKKNHKKIGSNNSQKTKILLKGLKSGVAVHMGECCFPLNGERIIGLMTEDRGVTVHTLDCSTLERFTEHPELWVDLAWDDIKSNNNFGRINVILTNTSGSLNVLTETVAKFGGNITNLIINKRSEDFFELSMDIEVIDIKHLNEIITGLRASINVFEVNRVKDS